jgi:MFS family permease
MKSDFVMGDSMIVTVVGAAKLGAVLGTFVGGATMLHYGRRIAIATNSMFFTAGPLIMAVAYDPWWVSHRSSAHRSSAHKSILHDWPHDHVHIDPFA